MNGKTDLSSYNNDWFKTGGSSVKRLLWYFFNLIFLRSGILPFNSIQIAVLKMFGARIGSGVVIKPHVNIKYPWNLKIGDHTWIGESVWIDNLAFVSIGDNVCLSQGSFLLTGNHDFTKVAFNLMTGEIVLEDGVWIGAKSIVCPGVNCYSHSVLAVDSVANKDLEAYKIYRGNPAIEVKDRNIEF